MSPLRRSSLGTGAVTAAVSWRSWGRSRHRGALFEGNVSLSVRSCGGLSGVGPDTGTPFEVNTLADRGASLRVELVRGDFGAATRFEVRIVPTRRVTSVSAMEATVQSVPRHSSVPADASGSGRTCNDFGPRRGVTVPNLVSSALCHGKIQLSLTCKMAAAETDGSAVEWSTSKQGGVVPLRNLECHSERGRLHCPMAKRSPVMTPGSAPGEPAPTFVWCILCRRGASHVGRRNPDGCQHLLTCLPPYSPSLWEHSTWPAGGVVTAEYGPPQ
jgi:hypothetical protein